ncbi:MAG: hypothetical protein ACTHV8_01625 [Nesterenkonia sp.]
MSTLKECLGNWRTTFRLIGQDVELVTYKDYHWEAGQMETFEAVHPGEILREDVIKELGLSVSETADRLGVS